MLLNEREMRILSLLGENAKQPNPSIINSETIAEKLHLSLYETRNIIKCLRNIECVQSDLEGNLSLITRKGMQLLERQ